MKLLGALSVMIGCGLFGFVRAVSLSRREKCIAAVMDSLRYMSSELKSEAMPLPELIALLSQTAGDEVKKFYVNLHSAMGQLGEESFESLWSNTVATCDALDLSREQKQILCKAGSFMGRFSVDEQCTALSGCIERFEPEYRLAREKAREGKKLYPGLGLTAGLMLAAMFL